MSNFQAMLDKAYADFDAMVAEEELQHRGRLRAAGWPKELIDKAIERCAPTLAERRATIPQQVQAALIRAGVPEEGSA